MTKQAIILKTLNFAKQKLSGEGSGHDFWHIHRVYNTALYLAKKEGADIFVVSLAALLHDIADWKFNDNDRVGSVLSRSFLESLKVDKETVDNVCHIIEEISFKGAEVKNKIKSLEGQVVQDADRLDALGAIGIARTFAYGGYKGREIYNPKIKPVMHKSFATYKKNTSPSVNHFYEKLLLLKDLMNTKTGKKLALKRHKFMEKFLVEFYKEIN